MRVIAGLIVGMLVAAGLSVALAQAVDPNAVSARYAVEHAGVQGNTTVGPRAGLVVQTPVHLHS